MPSERFYASALAYETCTASRVPVGAYAIVGDSDDSCLEDLIPPSGTDGWAPGRSFDLSDSSQSTLEWQFERLVAQWKEESEFMSSPTDMVSLPSYLQIMALGKPAIPLLLQELQREVDHWFCALAILSGADPVDESMAGDVPAMAQAWLKWGAAQGHI